MRVLLSYVEPNARLYRFTCTVTPLIDFKLESGSIGNIDSRFTEFIF